MKSNKGEPNKIFLSIWVFDLERKNVLLNRKKENVELEIKKVDLDFPAQT